jgi:UDP-glucose 4-epimerase
VGANLVPKLLARGLAVRVLDNLARGSRENLDGLEVELVEADIRDAEAVASALDGVETVVHLAAYGSVAESVEEPLENFDVNVRGTVVLLTACARAGATRFVFASTGGALVGNAPPPIDETTLPWPISPYGASKLCGEAYCHAFAGSLGLSTVALRFANVYGPVSQHKRGAVTNFVRGALRGEPLVIYGDGSASRDFLYVDDLCDGISAALDLRVEDEVVNLASGTETTIGDLARLVLELAGATDTPILYEPRRRGEVERNFARTDRAAALLGFRPAHSLEDGLRKTIDWYAERDLA